MDHVALTEKVRPNAGKKPMPTINFEVASGVAHSGPNTAAPKEILNNPSDSACRVAELGACDCYPGFGGDDCSIPVLGPEATSSTTPSPTTGPPTTTPVTVIELCEPGQSGPNCLACSKDRQSCQDKCQASITCSSHGRCRGRNGPPIIVYAPIEQMKTSSSSQAPTTYQGFEGCHGDDCSEPSGPPVLKITISLALSMDGFTPSVQLSVLGAISAAAGVDPTKAPAIQRMALTVASRRNACQPVSYTHLTLPTN